MPELPRGTVTFLFTDVEGSTKLLHELGAEGYAEALAEHRRVIRDACTAHDGVEVDTQGDAFFFAFPTAPGAIAAAGEMTEALAAGPIRVRVGLHTGTPLLTDEGYVGGDVHRAARVAASGHGGQVLVSSSTAQLVRTELTDLGEHRFKDLSAPERVYQLGANEFPALKSLYRTNLPIPPTPFLGREWELAEVTGLLDSTRLLTLTGPGGTGKTRLAIQAAAEASDRYPDGIWWVPLALLRDSELVLETAAQVVGSKNGLIEHIAEKSMLLLFDNFEQVVATAPELPALLAACPNVRVLVTSREVLRVQGEVEYRVPPLAPSEAVKLFCARSGLEADETIAELCHHLDDLPLAVELAAARTSALSPRQIQERLSTRLDLLKGGRDADPRQATLRATIEWSYELLTAEEQRLFAHLSVFAGGCTLEAAEDVCGADLDTLQSLVEKSLLRLSGERYVMLKTIREYGRALLEGDTKREQLRRRHLSFFLTLVEEAEPELTGADQQRWYERLAAEQDNVREALMYACGIGDGERALMLAGTIWRFWWTRGQIAEAERWYERALAIGARASELARARGLFGSAHMAEARGDTERACSEFEQAATLLRGLDETRWLILALAHLVGLYGDSDPERFESTSSEALALAEASGDVRGAAIVKGNLGNALLDKGEDHRASELIQEALAGHRALGDVYGMATCLTSLATLALRQGDLDAGAAYVRESLRLSRSIQDALTLSASLVVAGAVVRARGDPRTAARLCAADEALLSVHGIDLAAIDAALLDDTVRAVRRSLGEEFDEAWAAGTNLDVDAAVALALDSLD
jgi:predicted ATPase/class 3 adenylate cyclase